MIRNFFTNLRAHLDKSHLFIFPAYIIVLILLFTTLGTAFAMDRPDLSRPEQSSQDNKQINAGLREETVLAVSELLTTTYIPILVKEPAPPVTTILTPDTGGELTLPGGRVSIIFPPGLVKEPTEVSIKAGPSLPPIPEGWLNLGPSFQLQARTLSSGVEMPHFLAGTAEIAIRYDPGALPAGPDPAYTSIIYWDEGAQRWVRLPSLPREDANGQPVLWTRTSQLANFSLMAMRLKRRAVIVLDPDENIGCIRDTAGNCIAVEWDYNLHTVLQLKTLLEACGLLVNLTVPDIDAPVLPGGHQLSDDERVEIIRQGDIGLTIAYNTSTGGFISPGMGGTEYWFSTHASAGPEDINFANDLLNAINARTGLTSRTPHYGEDFNPPRYEFLSDELAILAPEKPYAHIEVAFLTFVADRQFIDYDYGLDTNNYNQSRDTNFAFPIYLTILDQLGLPDCRGFVCFPSQGLNINNKPRLAPPVQITDPFFLNEGIEWGDDYAANSDLDQAYRQIRGEDAVSYKQEAGTTITESINFPLTSTLYTTGISQVADTVTVSATDFVSTTSGLIPAAYSDNNGNTRLFRPAEYSFLGGVFQLTAGWLPQLSENEYSKDEIAALTAGSCQGLSYMTAAFCAKLLDPNTLFGQSQVGNLRDDGLFSEYLNYYQMVQAYLPGTDTTATAFFDDTIQRMEDPEDWLNNPNLLRLSYCPPDSCECWGHVVLPYLIFEGDNNTVEMYVYDPNLPQDDEVKVILDRSTGTWSYQLRPDLTWTGTEVNYLQLSDFPDFGTPVEDLMTGQILVSEGGIDYGRPRASYGTLRIPYGRPRASYGEDGEGLKLGSEYDGANNLVCHNEIAGGRRLSFDYGIIPGSDWKPLQLLLLPQNNYSFTFGEPRQGRISGGTFYTPEAMYTFNGTSAPAGRDQVKINPDLSIVTHTTTLDAKALSMAMYRETEEWTRIFGVSHTSLQAGEENTFRAGEDDDSFEYINRGSNKTYDLGLVQVDTTGVGMFADQDTMISGGDRHIIKACNWDELNYSLIFRWIDHGNDDVIDEKLVVTPFPYLGEEAGRPKLSAMAVNGFEHWFGTVSSGLIHYQADTKTTTVYDTDNSPLLHNGINDLAIAPNGDVWIATNLGISRYDGTNWQNYTEADGLIHQHVNSITVSPSGIVWVGTSKGVSKYSAGVWTSYTTANGLPHNQIKALTVEANETLWVLTANGDVVQYNGSAWLEVPGLPQGSVEAMTTAEGIIWFATNRGLVKYENGLWTNVSPDTVNLHEVTDNSRGKVCRSNVIWASSEPGRLGIYDYIKDEWLVSPR